MTFREANNMIDDISWFYGGESITTDDIVECREICHKALEKQIPKKPNKKGYPFDSDIDPLIYGYCPCCNAHMNSSKAYCDKCGQAVDWSDTE